MDGVGQREGKEVRGLGACLVQKVGESSLASSNPSIKTDSTLQYVEMELVRHKKEGERAYKKKRRA